MCQKSNRFQLEPARALMIKELQLIKGELIKELEHGSRDYPELQKLFDKYIGFQMAADILADYSTKGENGK